MTDAPDLSDKTVAFLATDGVEQVELTAPWEAVKATGATVHLLSNVDQVQGFNHLDKADSFPVDRQVHDANPSVYDALVLPGGVANPDALRADPDAVAFVRSFLGAEKLVAAICHAPWVLVEADGVQGRRLASWPSLRTDLENAGATWVDEAVVIDDQGSGVLITSRKPDDLDDFNRELVAHLAGAG
jgi:protease I